MLTKNWKKSPTNALLPSFHHICWPVSTWFDLARQPKDLNFHPNWATCLKMCFQLMTHLNLNPNPDQQWLNMTPKRAESEHDETIKHSRSLKAQTARDKLKSFSYKLKHYRELNTQTLKSVFLSGLPYRHELSIDLQNTLIWGRDECLSQVGRSGETSLQPSCRRGECGLAVLQSRSIAGVARLNSTL